MSGEIIRRVWWWDPFVKGMFVNDGCKRWLGILTTITNSYKNQFF